MIYAILYTYTKFAIFKIFLKKSVTFCPSAVYLLIETYKCGLTPNVSAKDHGGIFIFKRRNIYVQNGVQKSHGAI